MWWEILLYILGGILTGFLAGLLGIGGGLVLVPFLVFFLPLIDIPSIYIMHIAIATSLAIIVVTSFSSAYSHNKAGGIRWDIVKKMVLGCLIGALIGAQVADFLPSNMLQVFFGFFVFFMSYRLLAPQSGTVKKQHLPKRIGLGVSGLTISGICTLLGTGGGSLLVPFFSFFGLPMQNAVATSAACGFPIALAGVVGLLFAGHYETITLPYMTGYVYWPAFLGMVIPSVIFAPIGAKIAYKLPTITLRKIFGAFLIFVGVDMLYKSIIDMAMAAVKLVH